MPQQIWIVVGATRGIGLEFTRQLLAQNHVVIATARSIAGASQLWPLTGRSNGHNLKILECDVSDQGSIKNFAEEVRKLGRKGSVLEDGVIHCVVLNAGILVYPNRISEISFSGFAQHLHTNTIGPLVTAQHLLRLSTPLSPDHPVSPTYSSPVSPLHIRTLVFMSSDSGSTMNFRSFEDGFGAYAASKAALNQALRHLATELHRKYEEMSTSHREKQDAPVVLAIHPGEVATDMAADADLSWEVEGIITPEESVRNVLQVIEEKGKGGQDEGGMKSAREEGRKVEQGEAAFFTWEGKRYPW